MATEQQVGQQDGQPNGASAFALSYAAKALGLSLAHANAPDTAWIFADFMDERRLPAGWRLFADAQTNRPFYYSKAAGKSSWKHPALAFYRGAFTPRLKLDSTALRASLASLPPGAIYMARGGQAALDAALAADPPSEADIQSMRSYFGVSTGEPAAVQEVTRMAVVAPLPAGWEEQWEKPDIHYFRETARPDRRQLDHPLDAYFSFLIQRRRRVSESAGAVATAEAAATVGAMFHEGRHTDAARPVASREARVVAEDTAVGSTSLGLRVPASLSQTPYVLPGAEPEGDSDMAAVGDEAEADPPPPIMLPPETEGEFPPPPPLGMDSDDDLPAEGGAAEIDVNVAETAAEGGGGEWEAPAAPMDGNAQAEEAETQSEAPLAPSPALPSLYSLAKAPSVKPSRERFTVCVRARPLERNARSCWVLDPMAGSVTHASTAAAAAAAAAAAGREASDPHGFFVDFDTAFAAGAKPGAPGVFSAAGSRFKLDAVYDGAGATSAVYDRCVSGLVRSALEGVSGTVFAYGQTGSGKTHTIIGTRAQPGVLPLAVRDLFIAVEAAAAHRAAGQPAPEYRIRVGMLELYNEELRDLLAHPAPGGAAAKGQKPGARSTAQLVLLPPTPFLAGKVAPRTSARGGRPAAPLPIPGAAPVGPRLVLQEDAVMGVLVGGLRRVPVSSAEALSKLLKEGFARRQVGAHKMNDVSSRSHVVFRLEIAHRPPPESDGAPPPPMRFAVLNIVDLAGSERIAKSGASGARVAESTNINLSLLALGNVIGKLASRGAGASLAAEHIPYRDSKLTRLLQPCLGGNSRTAVIATISTSEAHAEETAHTLRFGARAVRVTNAVRVNELPAPRGTAAASAAAAEARLARAQLSIADLESQLAAAKKATPPGGQGGGGRGGPPANAALAAKASIAELMRGASSLDAYVRQLAMAVGGMGRGGGGTGEGGPTAETVLAAVRGLRSEREELRRRTQAAAQQQAAAAPALEGLAAMQAERQSLDAALRALEEAFGGQPPPQAPLVTRLQAVAGTAGVMSAELGSLQQRAQGSLNMFEEVAAREHALRAEVAAARSRERELLASAKERAELQDALNAALLKRDEMCLRLGKVPEKEFGSAAATATEGPFRDALAKYVRTLEAKLKERDDAAASQTAEVWALRNKVAKAMGDALAHGGRAAVRAAREAILRAVAAEEQLAAWVAHGGTGTLPMGGTGAAVGPTSAPASATSLRMDVYGTWPVGDAPISSFPLPPLTAAPAAVAGGLISYPGSNAGSHHGVGSALLLPAVVQRAPGSWMQQQLATQVASGYPSGMAGERLPTLLASQTAPMADGAHESEGPFAHLPPQAHSDAGERYSHPQLQQHQHQPQYYATEGAAAPHTRLGGAGGGGNGAMAAKRQLRASLEAASAAAAAAEAAARGGRKQWVENPTGRDYSQSNEITVLRRRVVAAEHDRGVALVKARSALHKEAAGAKASQTAAALAAALEHKDAEMHRLYAVANHSHRLQAELEAMRFALSLQHGQPSYGN